MASILYPAAAWSVPRSRYVRLWHGCIRQQAEAVIASGVDPTLGRPDTDFGCGFYTTTLRRQARQWAWMRHLGMPPHARPLSAHQPVVVWFRVERERLAKLASLVFILGDYHAVDYWSFVQHCRQSGGAAPSTTGHHERHGMAAPSWYDVVHGPVAAFWQQRVAMSDADQISFHTPAAALVLNGLLSTGKRGVDYDVESVP
jgi:hypothetical protein